MPVRHQDSATREDIGMLSVMEALADKEEVTQRELSRQTGLNLKKVNYCLHKLLEKGFVKFQRALNNPDKRAYLYILTSAGMKEKSRLTYRFLKFTMGYYNRVEEKLEKCLAEMRSVGIETVLLYGATDAARIVMGLVGGNGIRVNGVVDERCEMSEFGGVPVIEASRLKDLKWDGVLITAFDDLDGVEEQLAKAGIASNKVWRLS